METHIFSATGPTSAPTRVFISSAALLVKVMARISNGLIPWSRMRWAMRCVSTRVLPDPGARHDEQRALGVGDRLRLDGVQPGEERVVRRAHEVPKPTGRL